MRDGGGIHGWGSILNPDMAISTLSRPYINSRNPTAPLQDPGIWLGVVVGSMKGLCDSGEHKPLEPREGEPSLSKKP